MNIDSPALRDLSKAGDLELASDASPFRGLMVHMEFTDGSESSHYYDAQALARHFGAGTWFSLPLDTKGRALQALYVRVDKPMGILVSEMLELDSGAHADGERLSALVSFALVVGMMGLAAFYCASLFIVMKAKFILYHAFTGVLLALYTIASSSLIFLFFPGTTLWVRSGLSYGCAALAMAMLVPFLLSFLERDALSPLFKKIGMSFTPFACFAALVVPIFGEVLPFKIRPLYHLLFVPGPIIFTLVCVNAWRRGSIAVRYVVLAWALPVAMAAERVLRGLNFYSAPIEWDYGFYVAMGYESIVMVMAVAWRVSQLRRERDRALARRDELTILAETDGLTGLPNRRSFDRQEWMEKDHLVLLDVDHFKLVNDQHGHLIGDAVLKVIGRELAFAVEDRILVRAWRLGGEEFGALIVSESGSQASVAMDELRQNITAAVAHEVSVLKKPLTLSVGVAPAWGATLSRTYRLADAALYRSKALGRDRVCYTQSNSEKSTIYECIAAA
ncbi:sensor domain-containing diguanylate cyclase [Altericroceibacterium indicum]|nr:diguanylate cyclase [Altericroceibacterium indicum]